jgi:hypothetical protein
MKQKDTSDFITEGLKEKEDKEVPEGREGREGRGVFKEREEMEGWAVREDEEWGEEMEWGREEESKREGRIVG